MPSLEAITRELQLAARSLLRQPAFLAVTITSLTLGIACATVMFSVLDGVLLRPPPGISPSGVAVLWTAPPERRDEHLPLSYADLTGFQQTSAAFTDVAGVIFQGAVDIVMRDGDRAVPVGATWVTGNYFDVLQATPARGRLLTSADDAANAAPVVVISHALWQQQYAGSEAAVGRSLLWNDTQYTIVGVMPPGFEYPRFVDAWFPVLATYPATAEADTQGPQVMVFDAVGRLAPTSALESSISELSDYLARRATQGPLATRGRVAAGASLTDRVVGDVRPTLMIAAAAVGVLLLICCANVANLFVMRGTRRSQEFAIRTALGAGRGRLIRQLFVETGLVALVAGALAVGVAFFALEAVVALAPAELPNRALITLDARVFTVTLALMAVVTVLCGSVPAAVIARANLGSWLRSGRNIASMSHGTRSLRHGFVIAQVSLTIVVTTAAGLLAKSAVTLQQADMGFNAENLVIAETMLSESGVPDRARQLQTHEALLDRIAEIPGVVSATALPKPPFSGEGGWIAAFNAEGQSLEAAANNATVDFDVVGRGFFDAMQVPLLAGRGFDSRDRSGGELTAVVSTTIAQRAWGDADPIGRRIRLGTPENAGPWMTVVGLADETRYRTLLEPRPTLYLPLAQFGGPVPMTYAIRTERQLGALRTPLRAALAEVSPDLSLVSTGLMSERRAVPLARPRFLAGLFTVFALLTMTLAMVGLYGTIAATVGERTREMAVRQTMGASPRDVRRLVLWQGRRLAVAGLVLGLLLTLAATRLMGALLYGVGAADPSTFMSVALLVLLTSELACWIPALRAVRTNPMVLMRAE